MNKIIYYEYRLICMPYGFVVHCQDRVNGEYFEHCHTYQWKDIDTAYITEGTHPKLVIMLQSGDVVECSISMYKLDPYYYKRLLQEIESFLVEYREYEYHEDMRRSQYQLENVVILIVILLIMANLLYLIVQSH